MVKSITLVVVLFSLNNQEISKNTTKIYDKSEDFSSVIDNFAFLDGWWYCFGTILWFYVLQLVHYARVYCWLLDFNERKLCITGKILSQGIRYFEFLKYQLQSSIVRSCLLAYHIVPHLLFLKFTHTICLTLFKIKECIRQNFDFLTDFDWTFFVPFGFISIHSLISLVFSSTLVPSITKATIIVQMRISYRKKASIYVFATLLKFCFFIPKTWFFIIRVICFLVVYIMRNEKKKPQISFSHFRYILWNVLLICIKANRWNLKEVIYLYQINEL